MLRLIIASLLMFCALIGQSQDEYVLILEKAKYLHKSEKNTEGAIELLDSTWSVCKKETSASDGCMKILTYLAYYYRTNRNYDVSLEHYLMMIEYDKEGDHQGKAYNYISQVLNKKRNHSLAMDMAIKGYNHKKTDCTWKHNLSHSVAKSIIRLGDSTLYSQGLAWIDSSLIYYKKCGIGNSKVIANRLNDKGNIFLKMNNHSEAISAYKRCIELLENNAKTAPQIYRIFNNLGASYSRLGNHKLAIDYYQKSIAIYREYTWEYGLENLSVLYRNMARSSSDQKDYFSALEWIKKSDDYLENCLLKDSTFLAAIHSDKIRNREKELSIYMNSYHLSQDKKDLVKSYNAGKLAFTRYLILRSMVFGDQTRMIGLQEIKNTIDKLVNICLELGKVDEAFFICEKTKYLNLLEHLDLFSSSSISKTASRLQLIPTSISDLRELIGARNKAKIYLEQEIKQFGQILSQNESTCIHSYYLLEDNYVLFVRKNGTTQFENLEKAEIIDSLIVSFLRAVKNRKPIDSYAERLNLHLLSNRESVDTNILIIPHGNLAKMPFAALKEDNKYLISNVEFNYKKLLLLPNAKYKSNLHLGIQPQYEGSKLNGKLPFAKNEAQYLRRYFGFEVLQEDEATLENLIKLNKDLNVAHIIGHCTMDTENYRNSYFSLSNDQKWTPLDILNTPLRSNLLVLSACSTADGEFDLEEGIRGISYVFNIIGNNNQITTNWSIDDEANFTIFKSFYKNLNGKNTIGQALRLSQLEYLDNASTLLGHPYFWAGMRYEGDPELKIEMMPEKNKNILIFSLGVLFLLALFFVISRKFNY